MRPGFLWLGVLSKIDAVESAEDFAGGAFERLFDGANAVGLVAEACGGEFFELAAEECDACALIEEQGLGVWRAEGDLSERGLDEGRVGQELR